MIYTLCGIITESDITSSSVVVECGGVGYRLTVTANTLATLPTPLYNPDGTCAAGEKVRVYTHMSVKEDAVELFGFSTKAELDAFKLLISVSGVGPKAAMAILSLFTPQKLAITVAAEDTKSISRAPGVGGKTAARVVLELKDKLIKAFPEFDIQNAQGNIKNTGASADKGKMADARDALAVLGYSRSEIAAAMKNVDMSGSVEEIIRESLASLMKQ